MIKAKILTKICKLELSISLYGKGQSLNELKSSWQLCTTTASNEIILSDPSIGLPEYISLSKSNLY